jgi:hypothetical protein
MLNRAKSRMITHECCETIGYLEKFITFKQNTKRNIICSSSPSSVATVYEHEVIQINRKGCKNYGNIVFEKTILYQKIMFF